WAVMRNGYHPMYAIFPLLVVWTLGFVAFGIGYQAHVMQPTDKDAYASFRSTGAVPANYEPFCALTYAIDTSLPIISFGQRDKWHVAAAETPINEVATRPASEPYRILCQASFAQGWFARAPSSAAANVAIALGFIRWICLAS